MKTLRRAGCIALVCLIAGPVASSQAASATQDSLVRAVNYTRQAHGLRQLAPSPHLMRSSSGFAAWLMGSNVFGHVGGISAGGGFRALGEVLRLHSGGRPRYAATVRAWLASPGHRAVVLSPAFTHAGAGIARGTFNGRSSTIWVLHVGAR